MYLFEILIPKNLARRQCRRTKMILELWIFQGECIWFTRLINKNNMIKKTIQISLLIFLTFFSVSSSFSYFDSMLDVQGFDKVIRQFEERIKNVGNLIPFSHGIIGYFSDEPTEYNFNNETIEYVLAQYALAPLIINKDVYHKWNILNMSHESYEIWDKKYGDEYRLISSGGGFYLIERLP
jgi:hypothetical protein